MPTEPWRRISRTAEDLASWIVGGIFLGGVALGVIAKKTWDVLIHRHGGRERNHRAHR